MATLRLTSISLKGSIWLALITASGSAVALDNWRVDATNRLQAEHYDNSGNETASPYPDEGLQTYNEVSINLNRRLSPYERLSISMNAVASDSTYRSRYQGGNLERARLFWEKGDGPVPLRLEGGDFYAYQTTRTMQASLKGAQAEFQPGLGGPKHSIQVFAGQQAGTYRDFDGNQPTFAGASWLMEEETFGALSLNTSHARREPLNASTQDQQVASLAHGIPFSVLAQDFQLESELAYLQGDVANDTEKDQGYYAQLSGRSQDLPLRYSAAYTLYGENYQPFGAAVVSDQRSVETSVTWRFQSGRFLRGRFLDYEDGVESANPTDTRTTGLTYGGQLLDWSGVRVFGNLDGFVTEREDENNTLHTRDSNLNASFTMPVTTNVSTRLALLGQIREDELAGTTSYLRQANAAVDYRFQIAGLSASLSPGVLYRELTGDNQDSRDLNPALNGSLRKGDHALRFSYNSLRQEAREPALFDTLTQRASLQYSYRYEQHRLGVEGQYYDRQPDVADETYASRVMVFWEYRFGKAPASLGARQPVQPIGNAALSIVQFAPGTPADQLAVALDSQGLGEPRSEGDLVVYETPVLEEVQRRQRLAYEIQVGRLRSTNVIIDFDQIGDGQSAQRTFDQILGDLIARFGSPEIQIQEGDFGTNLSSRLATGQFARTYQWTLDGQILRFGIPSRIDGVVRMELRYADDLPPAEQNDWSLRELR